MADNLTKRADDYAQWYNDLVLKADLRQGYTGELTGKVERLEGRLGGRP